MEMYILILLGVVAVSYLGKIYWDIYKGWRAWQLRDEVKSADLVQSRAASDIAAAH